jgi:hypothetical protein
MNLAFFDVEQVEYAFYFVLECIKSKNLENELNHFCEYFKKIILEQKSTNRDMILNFGLLMNE